MQFAIGIPEHSSQMESSTHPPTQKSPESRDPLGPALLRYGISLQDVEEALRWLAIVPGQALPEQISPTTTHLMVTGLVTAGTKPPSTKLILCQVGELRAQTQKHRVTGLDPGPCRVKLDGSLELVWGLVLDKYTNSDTVYIIRYY